MSTAARATIVVAVGALVVGTPKPAAAHGIGGRADLPVPIGYFLVGAGIVLVLSFLALAALWKTPRFKNGPMVRSTGSAVGRRLSGVLSALG